MYFNVKSNVARAVCEHILLQPNAKAHPSTGFWRASAAHVLEQRYVRIACMEQRIFLLEAEIDPQTTHIMTRDRVDEYVEFERIKFPNVSLDNARNTVLRCIDQNRIVVGMQKARPINTPLLNLGKNPVWYSGD